MSTETMQRGAESAPRASQSTRHQPRAGAEYTRHKNFVPWPMDTMTREEVVQWGKRVHQQTQNFLAEDRKRSWWAFWSTMIVLNGFAIGATMPVWWPIRLACGVVMGLTIVRLGILYHDYFHGAILKGNRVVDIFFKVYSLFFLNPWTLWKQSHNGYHHGRAGLYVGAEKSKHALLFAHTDIGAFPVLSTHEYARSGFWKRLSYRIARSPLMILFGVFSIFIFSICMVSLASQPRHRWWSALSLVLNAAVITTLAFLAPDVLLFAFVVPPIVAAWLSVYMFYCQHNYPGMRYFNDDTWDHMATAVFSSSYMKTGHIMRWFTANLGYHHVHHANAHIPFYRLPEAMDAIPELRNPITTTLWPWDMYRCLRLKLWDPDRFRMVTFAEFRKHQKEEAEGKHPGNQAAFAAA